MTLFKWFVRGLFVVVGLLPALVGAQQLPLRYYMATEGLSNLGINALAQESGGALWIGTENGLYRHDGEAIRRVEGGPRQVVYGMAFGADGALWVAGQVGLYRRGGNGGSFIEVPTEDGVWKLRWGQSLATLPDGSVLVIDLEGGLWRVTVDSTGTSRKPAFPATLARTEPHAWEVRSILVGRNGAWWFGCGDALCRWHESRLERWAQADGVPRTPWLSLLETKDGSIWARGERHVVRLAPGAVHFANATPPGFSGVAGQSWLPLSEDLEGRVLTVGDGGVLRWQAGRWQHFGARNGLTEDRVHTLLPDRDGDVWLGTSGHGLAQWRGYTHWSSWTARQGLPSDAVWSIADDGASRVWIGTGRGVVSVAHGGMELLRGGAAGAGHTGGLAVADGSGGMWQYARDSSELFHRTRAGPWRKVIERHGLQIYKAVAAWDELWIISDSGLFTIPLDGSGPLRRRDELDRLAVTDGDRYVVSACREAGRDIMWLGTGGALLRFDPQKGFSRPRVEGLAPNAGIVYLACGAGHLWLRTAVGQQLMRIDQTDTGVLQAVPVSPTVLEGRRILSLLEDRRGWLWAGTDAGVVMWNGKDWRRFDESNGLAWNDCNQNALAEDALGAIWVGTSRGVTRIDQPERLGADAPLVLQLVQARFGQRDLVPGQKPELPWSTHPLEVRWEVPLFANRQAQHARYRLRGREDAWTDVTGNGLRYAGLGPGSYSLELIAINDDLGQRSPPVILDFVIAPPWWQSTPVLIVGATLVVAVVYAGHRFRIRRLVRRQGELETLVRERMRMAQRLEEAREDERRYLKREIHDEMGQRLAALRLGISIVDRQLGQVHPPLQERTRNLVTMVDGTIQVVRNVVAALRPAALDLGIVSALEWLAAEYSDRTQIPCELHVGEAELLLDDQRAAAVFRIAQESLTNVLRHAHAMQVRILFDKVEDHYLLEVHDNGLGFDPASRKDKSFGLLSMRERALMLGGEVEVSSEPGATVVRVRFPVERRQ